jgi:hypothetical protein
LPVCITRKQFDNREDDYNREDRHGDQKQVEGPLREIDPAVRAHSCVCGNLVAALPTSDLWAFLTFLQALLAK